MTSAADALVLARSIKSGFPLPLELLVQEEASGVSGSTFNIMSLLNMHEA